MAPSASPSRPPATSRGVSRCTRPERAPLRGSPRSGEPSSHVRGLAPGQVSDLRAALERSPADLMVSDRCTSGPARHERGARLRDGERLRARRAEPGHPPVRPGLTPLRGPRTGRATRPGRRPAARAVPRHAGGVRARPPRARPGPAGPTSWTRSARPTSSSTGVRARVPRSDLPSSVRSSAPSRGVAGDWRPPSWWAISTGGPSSTSPRDCQQRPGGSDPAGDHGARRRGHAGRGHRRRADCQGPRGGVRRRLPATCASHPHPLRGAARAGIVLVTNGGYTASASPSRTACPSCRPGSRRRRRRWPPGSARRTSASRSAAAGRLRSGALRRAPGARGTRSRRRRAGCSTRPPSTTPSGGRGPARGAGPGPAGSESVPR